MADKTCTAYVFATEDGPGGPKGGCWTLKSTGGKKPNTKGRVLGLVGAQSGKPAVGPGFPQQVGPQFSDVKQDLYGALPMLRLRLLFRHHAETGRCAQASFTAGSTRRLCTTTS